MLLIQYQYFNESDFQKIKNFPHLFLICLLKHPILHLYLKIEIRINMNITIH